MPGMHAETGRELTGLAHLRQSIRDILTTPVGTRVMRREYGSRLLELVDRPLTPATLTDIYADAQAALRRWEPRLRVDRIVATAGQGSGAAGHAFIDVEGIHLPDGEPFRLEGLEI